MNKRELEILLNKKVEYYNQPSFIKDDPISIPHQFTKKQDIEIAGFFAALFAWGQRKTIINKSKELMQLMDNDPYNFLSYGGDRGEFSRFLHFKHRTFQADDILFLLSFLRTHYINHDSLESAFTPSFYTTQDKQKERLEFFYNYVFSLEHLKRTEKHIATPAKNSACKRINMFLRWMVRQDDKGVDFGIWTKIKPEDLMIPMDVHVCRVAEELGLLTNPKANWQTTVNLTEQLRQFDAKDPVKYDFALFGMGVTAK